MQWNALKRPLRPVHKSAPLLAAIVLRERITLPQLAGFGLGAGGIRVTV
jgi:hypothetical protein